MNAIGYIRVSTGRQAEDDKYGPEAQREGIERYARAHGYKIVAWREDTASGASDERPALDEILYGDMGVQFEAVIAFKNDRIARDTKLYFYYLYVLERRGVKLLSTQESFDEGDAFANIYRALLQFVAEQERRNIALRTGGGRSMKAACGGYGGGRPPYGYRAVGKQLEIDPLEARAVRYVFQRHAEGAANMRIAREMNNCAFKPRTGKEFRESNVRRILANEALYRGMYKYGNGNTVQGVHEPILR